MSKGIIEFEEIPYNCGDCVCHNYHECCFTGDNIEDWMNRHGRPEYCPIKVSEHVEIGQTVWVITQYSISSEWEVVECKVTRKTIKKRSSFSVEGRYGKRHYNFYKGTFVDNSIGKTVFLNKEDAEKECKKKNNIRR